MLLQTAASTENYDTPPPVGHGTLVTATARSGSPRPRQRRYEILHVKRADAARVLRFHQECVKQAKAFSALSLPSVLVDPAGLIDKIFTACNGELGTVLYVNASSPRHRLVFETCFSGDDAQLRAAITSQQEREDDARGEISDIARSALAYFNMWIFTLSNVKRRKKTVPQCRALVKRFERYKQSLFLLVHGSRRLRFVAVARRKEQQRQHQHQSGADRGAELAYEDMF
jgi:hypothetical protein